jgi:hypothetical protein
VHGVVLVSSQLRVVQKLLVSVCVEEVRILLFTFAVRSLSLSRCPLFKFHNRKGGVGELMFAVIQL